MNINDETLSAFLDQELPEEQMTEMRQAIAADPTLSERLAELARADALVKRHASAIDSAPMPEAITAMLQTCSPPEAARSAPGENTSNTAEPTNNNVVALPLWRRGHQWLSQHAALAAGVMLVIGFAAGALTPTPTSSPNHEGAIMAHLDTLPSGKSVTLASNTQVQNRFTFIDPQGRPCRQYQVQTPQGASENIACRHEGTWQLEAMARTPDMPGAAQYRPASGAAVLDGLLDAMMPGGALSLQEEAQLMDENWTTR